MPFGVDRMAENDVEIESMIRRNHESGIELE